MLRRDIQGLRALAVVLVLLFHLWPNRVTGGYIGVDAFFVISGFLITSHLLSSSPRNLRDVGSFWASRIRRLLPASFLVLGVTLIASRLIAPETQWAHTASEIRSATLYVLNWQLAGDSVDYLASGAAPSPVQHYWSLSVEEQFYLGWPVLIVLLAVLAFRFDREALPVIMTGLSVVVVASLAFAVWMAANEPARGYFVTPTRIWELGAGALLAGYLLRRDRAGHADLAPSGPRRTAAVAVGLAAIVWAALTYSDTTPFPGWHAAIPVLGTALLIAVGPAARPAAIDRILDNPIAVRIGDLSYSIYLWHWPMIVLLPYVSGDHLGRLDKIVIITATFVLSALTKTWVEDRFRRPRSNGPHHSAPLRPVFGWTAVGMVALVVLSTVQSAEVSKRQHHARAELRAALQGDQACLGANATLPGARCPESASGAVVPAPAQAAQDRGEGFDCRELEPYRGTVSCTYGDPEGDIDVAIAGNSHALHWVPTLDRIGRESGWRITTFVSAGCPATDGLKTDATQEVIDGCRRWGQRVHQKLAEGRYDLVVMSTLSLSSSEDAKSHRRTVDGYRSYLTRLTERGGPPVLVIKDVPNPRETLELEVPDCISQHRDDLRACDGPRAAWVSEDALTQAARQMNRDDVRVADLTDRFCDATRCRAVTGGVIVYSDRSHMTATFARSLARSLAEPALAAMEAREG